MPARLIECLGTTEEFAELFSDRSLLAAMLRFETALARAQTKLGMIPASAAESISRAATPDAFDAAALAREAREHATVAIPLVHARRARVREIDEPSADFVHWGATSQDVMDTALVLLLVRAREILARDESALEQSLRAISEKHAGTVMLARTLLQPALPTTFGYKVAAWYAAVRRSWRAVDRSFGEAAQAQLGGAAGTLAAYGDQGPALVAAVAKELGLETQRAPWHAQRDSLAAVVTGLGLYIAGLGKIARDITLLIQQEIGEVSERGGGSSAMPHKRNPAGSAIVLAAATRAPGLVSAYLAGMVQEHERGVGGWQAEWPTIVNLVEASGSALAAMNIVIEHLSVHPERMRANLLATRGIIFSEKAVNLLARKLGRSRAQRIVAEAVESKQPFGEALRKNAEATAALTVEELRKIDDPEDYLGAAEKFRRRLLED